MVVVVFPSSPGGSHKPPDSEDDPSVRTRWQEDELVVVATLPGVEEADLLIDLDKGIGILTFGVGGEVIERVSLDDTAWRIADQTFTEGVLELRLTRE